MGNLLEMYSRLKQMTGRDKEDNKRFAEAEAFLRWQAEPYYELFKAELEDKLRTEGIGVLGYEELLTSQGRRSAYLELLTELKRREKVSAELFNRERELEDEE